VKNLQKLSRSENCILRSVRAEVRLEAFNVFNHSNLGNPAVAIDNPATVARITSMAGSPRQLQLSVRFAY